MANEQGQWSQVKRKWGRLRNAPAPTDIGAGSLADILRPNPSPELSVDELWRYHEMVTQHCQASEWLKKLRGILESVSTSQHCPVITKAVCLGPGTFEPTNGGSHERRTAHVQTAAFCSIAEHFSPVPLLSAVAGQP